MRATLSAFEGAAGGAVRHVAIRRAGAQHRRPGPVALRVGAAGRDRLPGRAALQPALDLDHRRARAAPGPTGGCAEASSANGVAKCLSAGFARPSA